MLAHFPTDNIYLPVFLNIIYIILLQFYLLLFKLIFVVVVEDCIGNKYTSVCVSVLSSVLLYMCFFFICFCIKILFYLHVPIYNI